MARYSYVWNNPLRYTDPSGYDVSDLTLTYLQGNTVVIQPLSSIFTPAPDPIYQMQANLSNTAGNGYNLGDFNTEQQVNSVDSPTPSISSSGSISSGHVLTTVSESGGTLEQRGGSLGSHIPGTQAGHNAATYWANRLVASGGGFFDDPVASVGLAFSVLWTEDTAVNTALTLGTAGIGALLTRVGLLRFGPHDKTGGFSIGIGRNNARIDYGKLPNRGKSANRLPEWARGKKLPHYHRRGPGGIGRHRPWQETPGVPKWKFWERF
jgi:hypothetical protein